MCHYAMRTWPGLHRGAIMLFGHSHGKMPGYRNTMDVGVDAVGFSPITMEQVRARLAELPVFNPEDAAGDDEDDTPSPP